MEIQQDIQHRPLTEGPQTVTHKPHIIAVDGPAGSGKSSLCYMVSRKLGWSYVNTGAIYRAVGLTVVDEGVSLEDEAAVAALVVRLAHTLRWDPVARTLSFGGRDLTERLNSEEAGYAASKVARQPAVRRELLSLQRDLCLQSKAPGVLVDGRDIGTVVFPDAALKIFLTASLEERTRRRLAQLGNEASASEIEQIRAGIARRDQRDSGRDVAPMKQADDARLLDTSAMNMEESIDALIALIREQGLLKS